eukprot:jgi/Psemu1/56606/gm1.56606_g
MLQALIEHKPQSVHIQHEHKHFINGRNHSKFLHSKICRKQCAGHLQHKFKPQNLVTTIMRYLNLPYSPINNGSSTPHFTSTNKQTGFDNPYYACHPTAPFSHLHLNATYYYTAF